MLDRDLQHPDITHILRTGEPLEVKYPTEAKEEQAYIKDEMRFERQREENMERRNAEKGKI